MAKSKQTLNTKKRKFMVFSPAAVNQLDIRLKTFLADETGTCTLHGRNDEIQVPWGGAAQYFEVRPKKIKSIQKFDELRESVDKRIRKIIYCALVKSLT